VNNSWSVALEPNHPYPQREFEFYGSEKEARNFFHEEVERQIAVGDAAKWVLLVNPEGFTIVQCACRSIQVRIVAPK